MNTLRTTWLTLLLWSLITPLTHAGESDEPVRICSAAWPGFIEVEDGRVVGGITHDVIHEAFRRLNRSVEMRELPWSRCLKNVEDGSYSAATDEFFPNHNPAFSQSQVHFNSAIFGICVRQDAPQQSLSLDLLQGQRVGTVRGYIYTPDLLAKANWTAVQTKDEDQLYTLLERGRVNFIVCDYWSALQRDQVRILQPFLDTTELGVVFNKAHGEPLRRAFDQTIGEMLADGTIDRLYKQHTGASDPATESPSLLESQ